VSHFLREGELAGVQILGKPRALAKVRVVRKKGSVSLEIVPEIGVARMDAQLVPLPDRVKVIEPGGKKAVRPSRGSAFWVTVETIDPFHGVVELPNDWRFFA